MGAVNDRRTTSSTTITKNHHNTATASLLRDEFSPIKEQEAVTTTTTHPPPSLSPPRDAFYDDVPDIVRVFALDYDRLYRSFCQRTAVYAFNAVVKLVVLVSIFTVDASSSTLFKVFATAIFLFGFIVSSALVLTAPHSWRGMAGQHVALTSTGIRYDRAYPSRETIHVRVCAVCVIGGASLVGRFVRLFPFPSHP
jgi:hypothetical protein